MRGRVGSTLNLFAQFADDDAQVMVSREANDLSSVRRNSYLVRPAHHAGKVVTRQVMKQGWGGPHLDDRPGRVAQRLRACNFHCDCSLHCL
jgi:hypothetical protein